MFKVPYTILFPSAKALIYFENILFSVKFMKMLENISLKTSSLLSGTLKTLKCLENLTVKGDLPPPGGAAQATSTVESTDFQISYFLS